MSETVAVLPSARTATSFPLSDLNEWNLLGRLVLPTVEPDATEDARIVAALLGNTSLGLLRITESVGPNAAGQVGTMRYPDKETGELVARILAPEGGVLKAIMALPDGERIRVWHYRFAAETYAARA